MLISFIKGAAPIQALEFGSRAIPGNLRPSFNEMEKVLRTAPGWCSGRPGGEVPNGPIIIKKVSGHAGHNGGAWKVAYADFVTAMMALFIVLWLLNSSKQVQEAVGGYFKDPTGIPRWLGARCEAQAELDLRKEEMKKIKEASGKADQIVTGLR